MINDKIVIRCVFNEYFDIRYCVINVYFEYFNIVTVNTFFNILHNLFSRLIALVMSAQIGIILSKLSWSLLENALNQRVFQS